MGKPIKLNMKSPTFYGPFTLLLIFSEGLERLARRMGRASIEYIILAYPQLGTLKVRSSVDLTTYLTHDMKNSLTRDNMASLTTLGINGAFDAVLPKQFVH